jgi:hypothetical protein
MSHQKISLPLHLGDWMRWDPGRRTPEDHHDIVAEEKQICDEAPSAVKENQRQMKWKKYSVWNINLIHWFTLQLVVRVIETLLYSEEKIITMDW